MRNFTHRWPQSEHFFSKLGHFLPIFKKVQGRPPPPSPLITRVFSTLTYPSPSGIPLEFPIWIRPFPLNQKVVRYGYGKLEKKPFVHYMDNFISWNLSRSNTAFFESHFLSEWNLLGGPLSIVFRCRSETKGKNHKKLKTKPRKIYWIFHTIDVSFRQKSRELLSYKFK